MRTVGGKERAAGGEERVARGRMRTKCNKLSEVVQARSAATRRETRALFKEVERQSEDTSANQELSFKRKKVLREQEVEVSSIESREEAKATESVHIMR